MTDASPAASPLRKHRGWLIITMGILGSLGGLFAIIAWIMGSRDLRRMEAGIMDPSGRSLTRAGRNLGIFGTAVNGLLAGLLIYVYMPGRTAPPLPNVNTMGQHELARGQLAQNHRKLEELLERANAPDSMWAIMRHSSGNETDAESLRRDTVKRLESLIAGIERLREGPNAAKVNAIRSVLRDNLPPIEGPMGELVAALSACDFAKATDAVQSVHELALRSADKGIELRASTHDLAAHLQRLRLVAEESDSTRAAAGVVGQLGESMSRFSTGLTHEGPTQEGMDGLSAFAQLLSELMQLFEDLSALDQVASEAKAQISALQAALPAPPIQ